MGPRSNFCAAALGAAALLFGCGDDGGGSGVDAAPADAMAPGIDAGFNEAACPTTYGPAAVGSTFGVAAAGVGFDLDGDTEVDNLLGENETLRGLLSASFMDNVEDGSLRLLSEIRDLGALGTDDSSVTVVLYGGVDSDDPVDLADDFTGDEDYRYVRSSVELEDCAPTAPLAGSYAGGVVTASADAIGFYIESLGGAIELRRTRLEVTIEADTKGFKTQEAMPSLFGAALPSCVLNQAPGTISLKAQEDLARLFMVQPDIDMDGDGLETVQALPGDGIVSCTDGDGTVIEGEDCGCDPRMADAYSVTFAVDLVGAGVLGPAAE